MIKIKRPNVKGYSSRDYFVAALFFGAVISLAALMVGSIATEYQTTDIIDQDFEEKYNRVEGFTTEINKTLSAVQENPGIVGLTAILFKASFAFINFLLNTLGLITGPTTSFIEDFNMPLQVGGILFTVALAIITITLLIRILSAVTQRRF